MAAEVTRLRTAPTRTLRTAAEAFLDTIGSANTRRCYGIAIVKTVDAIDGRGPDGLIGASRALDSVTDAEIGAALETLWGSAAVKSKGAKPRTRRRGPAHHEHVLETVYWDAGTARLLPWLTRGRARGPVFVTRRRPGPGKYLADRDVCPDTGLARLSYDQARDLLDAATAVDGPGSGWDLHELRHSGLTHLGESGVSLLELMAKSRHRKAENLRRYFKPSPQAMRELTALLGPDTDRRR